MANSLGSRLNLLWYPFTPEQQLSPFTELPPLAKSKLHVDWHILWPHVYSSTSKNHLITLVGWSLAAFKEIWLLKEIDSDPKPVPPMMCQLCQNRCSV